jgi:hypothetical protein
VYPLQISSSETLKFGDAKTSTGVINFGSAAAGSGARATTDAGLNWQTVAIAVGAAVIGFLLLHRAVRRSL